MFLPIIFYLSVLTADLDLRYPTGFYRPTRNFDRPSRPPVKKYETSDVVFADSSYKEPANSFNSGDTAYIRVVTLGPANKKKICRLLADDKQEILSINMSEQYDTGDTYIYTASFFAPNDPGNYYIDIGIEGDGISYSHQQNITVIAGSNSILGESYVGVDNNKVVVNTDPDPSEQSDSTKEKTSKVEPSGWSQWLDVGFLFKTIIGWLIKIF
jgi:hypothetical protein